MTHSFEELKLAETIPGAELSPLQEWGKEIAEMPSGPERDEMLATLGELYPEVDVESEVTGFLARIESNELDLEIGHRNLAEAEALLPVKPLVEIVPDQIPRTAENLLASRGVLAVVRAAAYEDFHTDIVPQLASAGLQMVKAELFPEAHRGMTGGSSRLHLDNFAEVDAPDYRYDLSTSRVDKGRVIFIGGQATARARDAHRQEHLEERQELREINQIQKLEHDALKGKSPLSPIEFAARNKNGERLHAVRGKLVAVTLNQGDVAFWAQGGPNSETPAWHAVHQVGNPAHPAFQARSSTSTHFVKS